MLWENQSLIFQFLLGGFSFLIVSIIVLGAVGGCFHEFLTWLSLLVFWSMRTKGGIVGIPFIYAVWISFHDKILGFPETPFVGLQHYQSLVTSEEYWHAVGLSVQYTGFCIAAKFVLGFGSALILTQPLPVRSLLRALIMLPWACPALVVVVIWFFLLNDVNGVFNWLLVWAGLMQAPTNWLGRMDTALPTLIGISIWRGFPFWTITLLAALQSVPQELYEAAAMDGANSLRQLLHVTLPGIRPVLLVVALLSTIWTFNEITGFNLRCRFFVAKYTLQH